MHALDWFVLVLFLISTVSYGIYKGRGARNTRSYMLADKSMPWYAVALSVMATQASAITFLTTTGQGYADGMRFVQFYFGLPIAMIILSAVAVPVFHRLNVFTAYEYLENRFDLKTRTLTAFIFLILRGLSTSISLYAPAIILSVILGWDTSWTLRVIGLIVVLYTTVGGVKSVNWNDFYQFLVIACAMVLALIMTLHLLPQEVSFFDAVSVAGVAGKLQAVDFSFDWKNRYNFWSGLIGGMFLALAYFGTDQSQVQRYLTARSITQSRLGLLFNGLAKVPMQFFILFVGAMVYVFYQFVTPPLFFNPVEEQNIRQSNYKAEYNIVQQEYEQAALQKRSALLSWMDAKKSGDQESSNRFQNEFDHAQEKSNELRREATSLLQKNNPDVNTNDTNYVFLSFVTTYLPAGVVGLVIVVVFAATMSSTSSEWNSLATTSVIDIYKRLLRRNADERHYLLVSRLATIFWGIFAVTVSERASRLGTLVEAVNILGSLFYGTVLGVFLLAFFFKRVGGSAAFLAALLGESFVLYLFFFSDISYLWYNVFGCLIVILCALILNPVIARITSGKRNETKF